MEILLTIVGTLGFLLFFLDWLWKPKLDLPYPKRMPVIGHLLAFSKAPHLAITQWAEACGGIYCIQILNRCLVIVTDYDLAYELLVTKGKDFAGKGRTFRTDMCSLNGQGIIFQPLNETWKRLRMVTHHSVKQFGEGLGRIEKMVHATAGELVQGLVKDCQNDIIDPFDRIYLAVTSNITSLALGNHLTLDDPTFGKIVEMEQLVMKSITISRGSELDVMPWLRHFGNGTYSDLTKCLALQRDFFQEIIQRYKKGHLPTDCLAHDLLSETSIGASDKPATISDDDARVTFYDILLSGVTTSAAALYILLLIMATHPSIQKAMHEEIDACLSQKINQKDKRISLIDRSNMPYTRACLFELLRYATVAFITIDHSTMKDTDLAGHKLPNGTPVYVNLFGLHHSEKYWDKPWDFNPDRFLDADRNLVASDHVNRKRLLVFGAGPRVCIGQSFALARMFILATSMMRAFEVTPAPGEVITHDPRKYELRAILNAPRAKICLKKRA